MDHEKDQLPETDYAQIEALWREAMVDKMWDEACEVDDDLSKDDGEKRKDWEKEEAKRKRRAAEDLAMRLADITARQVYSHTFSWSIQDREDLIQSVLKKLFKNEMYLLSTVDNPRAIPSWLNRVVFTEMTSMHRKRTGKKVIKAGSLDIEVGDNGTTLIDLLTGLLTGPDVESLKKEINQWYEEACGRCVTDPMDQAIQELSLDGLKPREIATVLNLDANVVSIRKTRIRGRLLEDLSDHFPDLAAKYRKQKKQIMEGAQ